jgi:Cd(II)/Pb(II)-responsive transcriptional regulator
MRIGELAASTGVAVETIRYYEREGLLPVPARSGGNYRVYGREAERRLLFVRHCRALDIKLDEIRHLLRLRDDPQARCGDVNALVDLHLRKVREQKRALAKLERQLKALRDQCHSVQHARHCGILKHLVAETTDR